MARQIHKLRTARGLAQTQLAELRGTKQPVLVLPDDLVQLEIAVPDHLPRSVVELKTLPRRWQADTAVTRRRGDAWAAALETPLLLVPSVLVPRERNLLTNPRHPASQSVRPVGVAPFTLDERLLGRGRRR